MAVYEILAVLAYNDPSMETGFWLQRVQVATLSLIGASFTWFIVYYADVRDKRIRNFLTVYFVLAAVLVLTDGTGLSWRPDQPAVKVISLPFGLGVTYYEVTPGPMTQLLSAMGVLVFVYAFYLALRLSRTGQHHRARPLFLAVLFFCLGLVNDASVQARLYRSVYIIEYTYLGIVMLMAYFLSLEVVRSAEMREAIEIAYAKLVDTSRTLTGSSERVHTATRNIDEAMTEVFSGTQSQNDHIKNSHKTINDLLANIHAISREAQQGAQASQDAGHRISQSLAGLKQTFEGIQSVEATLGGIWEVLESFTAYSRRIDQTAEFIGEIASRINVLSLNVAIEANQSGASRSGFEIVAREIRSLAKTTKEHAREIAELIVNFRNDTERLKASMREGVEGFHGLTRITDESRERLNAILALVEDEESRLLRISTRILDLRTFSQQVEKEMGTVAHVSERNLKTAERVNVHTREMSSKMVELSRLAESLREAAEMNAALTPEAG
jgi:methyl-accepting chemotaxis protein